MGNVSATSIPRSLPVMSTPPPVTCVPAGHLTVAERWVLLGSALVAVWTYLNLPDSAQMACTMIFCVVARPLLALPLQPSSGAVPASPLSKGSVEATSCMWFRPVIVTPPPVTLVPLGHRALSFPCLFAATLLCTDTYVNVPLEQIAVAFMVAAEAELLLATASHRVPAFVALVVPTSRSRVLSSPVISSPPPVT